MNRLKVLLLMLGICASLCLYAQDEVSGRIDLVISVDGEIAISSIREPKFVLVNSKGESKTVDATYHPGSLSVQIDNWEHLTDTTLQKVSLSFDFNERTGKNSVVNTYEIELGTTWFKKSGIDGYFTVLNIYNTDQRQNKKVFFPLEGKNYTYEMFTPDYNMTRVRKKGS